MYRQICQRRFVFRQYKKGALSRVPKGSEVFRSERAARNTPELRSRNTTERLSRNTPEPLFLPYFVLKLLWALTGFIPENSGKIKVRFKSEFIRDFLETQIRRNQEIFGPLHS